MRDLGKLLLLGTLLAGLLGLQAVPASAATSRTVSAAVSTTTPTVGSTISMSGKVSRSPKGTVVHVQRRSGSSWIKVAGVRTTSSTGSYRVSFRVPTKPATYTYRAYAPKTSKLKVAASGGRSVDVRRKVSITSGVSTGGVAEQGAGATLSGTVLVGSTRVRSAEVRLQRRSGSTWASVGAAQRTLSDGTYRFALPTSTVGTTTYRAVATARVGYAAATSPSRTLRVTIPAVPEITTETLTSADPGTAYAAQLAGSRGEMLWSLDGGALPAGLALSRGGRISGVPADVASGTTSTFRVRVTNAASGRSATKDLTLEVRGLLTGTTLPAATVGQAYRIQLTRHGSLAGVWSAQGLPAGLAVDATGLVTGTVATPGTSTVTVTFAPISPAYAPRTVQLDLVASGVVRPTGTTVSVGSDFACRVTTSANLDCWGYNFRGNLGTGPTGSVQDTTRSTPQPVGPRGVWRSVSASQYFSTCAVRTDNTLWCWGDNGSGQVGDPAFENILADSPVAVKTDTAWSTVSTGVDHACAVTTAGALWCWGSDVLGQLGQGAAGPRQPAPVAVPGTDWRSVSAGSARTCAVKTDDSLWCWGFGGSATPVRVGSSSWLSIDARAADANGSHTCGIQVDRSLWCWGANGDGQLGNGTTSASAVPVQVAGGRTWSDVAVGGGTQGLPKFTCATTTSGEVWCWGSNDGGQLGNGTASSTVPQKVDSSSWTSVATGNASACGVRADGTQYCWGSGARGQLGNGGTPGFPVRFPVPVRP